MSIGKNIKKLRENMRDGTKMTQEELAEKVGVSFQAVSAWERDEYKPETEKIPELMKALDASADDIFIGPSDENTEDKTVTFNTKDFIFNWEHMKTFVKTTARNAKMIDTLKAVDFAVNAHKGKTRKRSETPYIYHPLNMACHALSMGITEDEIIAAILLHDVIEDCKKEDKSAYTIDDLPVSDEAKELVRLMTKDKSKGSHSKETLDKYYGDLVTNPKAALIKCLDRINNMTTMSWAFELDDMIRYIEEVDTYYPALLKVVKDTPEYNNAAWLLQYQLESMLDIYKRLM